MLKRTLEIIYPASLRSYKEVGALSIYQTSHAEKIYLPGKAVLDQIFTINDEILYGNTRANAMKTLNKAVSFLLPLSGLIKIHDTRENENIICHGEMYVAYQEDSSDLYISNFYRNEAVNYLQITFRSNPIIPMANAIYTFILNANKNHLIEVFSCGHHSFLL